MCAVTRTAKGRSPAAQAVESSWAVHMRTLPAFREGRLEALRQEVAPAGLASGASVAKINSVISFIITALLVKSKELRLRTPVEYDPEAAEAPDGTRPAPGASEWTVEAVLPSANLQMRMIAQ